MHKLSESLTLTESRWLVLALCLIGTAFFILADVLIIHIWGIEYSISRVIRNIGSVYASILFALTFWLAFMIGHFFCGSG